MVPEVREHQPLPSVQPHQALPWLRADHLHPGCFQQNRIIGRISIIERKKVLFSSQLVPAEDVVLCQRYLQEVQQSQQVQEDRPHHGHPAKGQKTQGEILIEILVLIISYYR